MLVLFFPVQVSSKNHTQKWVSKLDYKTIFSLVQIFKNDAFFIKMLSAKKKYYLGKLNRKPINRHFVLSIAVFLLGDLENDSIYKKRLHEPYEWNKVTANVCTTATEIALCVYMESNEPPKLTQHREHLLTKWL